MRERNCLIAVAGAALLLAGCTHISTRPDDLRAGTAKTPDANGALEGIAYALPMLQYDITVTRALAKCPSRWALELPGGQSISVTDEALAFSTSVEAKPRYVPGERYLVDYRALQSWFKTTGFSMEPYASGALKSINVSAEDHTGAVVKDLVAVGLTVASTAFGVPLPAANFGLDAKRGTTSPNVFMNTGAMQPMIECTADTAQVLRELKTKSDALKAATAELPRLTKDVERLTIVAGLEAADHSDASALNAALRDHNAKLMEVERLTNEKAEFEGKVKVTTILAWPRLPEQRDMADEVAGAQLSALARLLQLSPDSVLSFDRLAAVLDASPEAAAVLREKPENRDLFKAFDAWRTARANIQRLQAALSCAIRPDENPAVCREERTTAAVCRDSALDIGQCVRESTRVLARLEDTGVGSSWCGRDGPAAAVGRCLKPAPATLVTDAADDRPDPGLFVRPPVAGAFRACLASPKGGKATCGVTLLEQPNASVPQLGQLRFLRFESRPFESAELALMLREDGSIEKFEFKKPKAMSAGIAAAAADAASQYKAEVAAQASARKTAREEEIARLQHELDLAAKKEELLKKQTPAGPTEAEALQQEIADIQLRTSYLQALIAQRKAEADLVAAGGS